METMHLVGIIACVLNMAFAITDSAYNHWLAAVGWFVALIFFIEISTT